MDFRLPAEITAKLAELDAFIEAEIKPLERENMQFFDHRREHARTDWDNDGRPRPEWRALISEMERRAYDMFKQINNFGGVIKAIEAGYFQREIAESAFRYQREIDQQKRIIVGVNEYQMNEPIAIPILQMDPDGERKQNARLAELRQTRDNERVGVTLSALREAARGTANTMPFILDAVKAYATLQEITDVFRDVFGVYQEPVIV